MDVMESRRRIMMGANNKLPSNIYHGYFTPDANLEVVQIDTGITNLDNNNSINVTILTHDLDYSVASQSTVNAIIQYIGYCGNGGYFNRYMCVKANGANDWWQNGTVSFNSGILTISGIYGRFVANCKYEVIVMS